MKKEQLYLSQIKALKDLVAEIDKHSGTTIIEVNLRSKIELLTTQIEAEQPEAQPNELEEKIIELNNYLNSMKHINNDPAVGEASYKAVNEMMNDMTGEKDTQPWEKGKKTAEQMLNECEFDNRNIVQNSKEYRNMIIELMEDYAEQLEFQSHSEQSENK